MDAFKKTSLFKYLQAIRALPRGIFNHNLFLTAAFFATAETPKGWDEGSAAAITQLPSFKAEFHLDSTKDSATISNLVSFVNLGAGIGALLSFLLNDRLGRIWSMRIYHIIYVIGTLISCFSYGHVGTSYTGRIVAGLGIGACTVVGPIAITEIAPKTVRGLMTIWVNVAMLIVQTLGIFTVYGCSLNISSTLRLQSQIPWFVQTFVPIIVSLLSFFVTTIIASLAFVDMVGRRGSLFTGITVQAICHSYLAGYLRYFVESPKTIPTSASDGAIAIIYIHGFSWAVGLYTLPYLFGAELWPNRIRSFGGALSQSFHWLFCLAITKATPSLISSMNTWGVFRFFAAWCIVGLLYTYFSVPETSGLSLDDLDRIFERHIYQMRRHLTREIEDGDDGLQNNGEVQHVE
ncbi:hypothetical protein LQW54_008917 [Pestalotiopsis sp. IQ-011]